MRYNNTKYVIFILIVFILFINYAKFMAPEKPKIDKLLIDENNKLVVNFSIPKYKFYKDIYCYLSTNSTTPLTTNNKWIKAKNNKCDFTIKEGKYYLFLKNNNKIYQYKIDNLGKIVSFNIKKDTIYLAIDSEFKIEHSLSYVGFINDTVSYTSSNPEIVSVTENGTIKAIKDGKSTITVSVGEEKREINVTSTSLIVKRPNSFDYDKGYLPCNKYNEEENDLLDEILFDRVKSVGYPTRASVVEAARFLTLELPYRLNYFSENGRLTYPAKIDGEGRYYHLGLYLDESRFSKIGKKATGPDTWGCNMYNRVSHRTSKNGFDCSGFVSWVLLNGGFDPGDIGAGVTSVYDLTDTGKRTVFNKKVVDSGVVKTGDLLNSGGKSGGHIAIIVGQDEDNYYVAESLWTGTTGVIVKAYSKSNLWKRYYYVILMDDYYKSDGDYTEHWKK